MNLNLGELIPDPQKTSLSDSRAQGGGCPNRAVEAGRKETAPFESPFEREINKGMARRSPSSDKGEAPQDGDESVVMETTETVSPESGGALSVNPIESALLWAQEEGTVPDVQSAPETTVASGQAGAQSLEATILPAEEVRQVKGSPEQALPLQMQGSGEEPEQDKAPPTGEKTDARLAREGVGTPPAHGLKTTSESGDQPRTEGPVSCTAQARPEQAHLAGDGGMSRGDQGLERRESTFVRRDTGNLQTPIARESQPVFDSPSPDLRSSDSVDQPVATSPPGVRGIAGGEQGQHAEPSVRTQNAGPAFSTEARGADAAHMEARATFDASGKAVHLRIQDQGLGSMDWHLRMEGGRVAAEAVVQSARVQHLVHAHQEALQARLSELGVRMEGVYVSVEQGSQGFSGHAHYKPVVSALGGGEPVPGAVVDPLYENHRALGHPGRLDLYA